MKVDEDEENVPDQATSSLFEMGADEISRENVRARRPIFQTENTFYG